MDKGENEYLLVVRRLRQNNSLSRCLADCNDHRGGAWLVRSYLTDGDDEGRQEEHGHRHPGDVGLEPPRLGKVTPAIVLPGIQLRERENENLAVGKKRAGLSVETVLSFRRREVTDGDLVSFWVCVCARAPAVCWEPAPGPRPPWRACSNGTWHLLGRLAGGSRWRGAGPPSWRRSYRRTRTCPRPASIWRSGTGSRDPGTSRWCPKLAVGEPDDTKNKNDLFIFIRDISPSNLSHEHNGAHDASLTQRASNSVRHCKQSCDCSPGS